MAKPVLSNKEVLRKNARILVDDETWSAEDVYWREAFPERTYGRDADYTTYQPAFLYGVAIYQQNPGKPYDELNKEELQGGWDGLKDYVTLRWNEAEEAVKDAYERLFDGDHSEHRNYGYQVPHE